MSNSANTSLTTTPPMLLTSGNGSGLSINKPVLVKIQDKLSDKLKSIASSNSHNMGSDSEDGKLESDGSMHRVSLVPSESAVLAETQQKFNGHSETPTVLLPHPSIPNNKDDFSHPYTNSSPNLNAINTAPILCLVEVPRIIQVSLIPKLLPHDGPPRQPLQYCQDFQPCLITSLIFQNL